MKLLLTLLWIGGMFMGRLPAFQADISYEKPVQGTVIALGEDMVDVYANSTAYRNVHISPPLTLEMLNVGDIVSLTWDAAGLPHVTAVLGRDTALRNNPRRDTTPPPPPVNVHRMASKVGAYLAWEHPADTSQIFYYQVDARLPGGAWGLEMYPVSEGTRTMHWNLLGYAIQARVRSVDQRGNWSGWVVCPDVLYDLEAPDAPIGLLAIPAVNGVMLKWEQYAQPPPDLAGFKVYRSLEDDGSDAVLVANTTGYEYFAASSASEVFYYNIKAFDTSGNESDYGALWVEGAAVYTDGTNLLTNADFERDFDGDGEADDWSSNTTTAWGDFGMGGGKGYKIDPMAVTIIPQIAWAKWDPMDNGNLIEPVAGQYIIASAYFKGDGGSLHYGYSNVMTSCWPAVFFSNGSDEFEWADVFAPENDDFYGYEAVGDDWYRVWGRHKVTEDDIESTPYVGVALVMFSAGGDRYCYADRPKLEFGFEPGVWTPGLVQPTDGSGLLGMSYDVLGISADAFAVNAATGDVHYSGDLLVTRSGDQYTGEVILDRGYVNCGASLEDIGTTGEDAITVSSKVCPAGCTVRVRATATFNVGTYDGANVVHAQAYLSNGTHWRNATASVHHADQWISVTVVYNYTYSSETTTDIKLRVYKGVSGCDIDLIAGFTELEWEIVG